MLAIQDAWRAAREVETAGDARPSLKAALWYAALSGQKKLEWNGRQARALRPYISQPLPQDVDAVRAIIASGHAMVTRRDAATVLYIEHLERTGQLARFERMPRDAGAWQVWRDDLYKLLHGHAALSYKMVSFAGLLMWPTHCQLVPVDVWVCRRLGRMDDYRRVSANLNRYREIESVVRAEWEQNGRRYALGVWHWYMWEVGRGSERCESHAALSPRAR